MATTLTKVGAVAFGVVIGWITYRTLRRREGPAQLPVLQVGVVSGLIIERPSRGFQRGAGSAQRIYVLAEI